MYELDLKIARESLLLGMYDKSLIFYNALLPKLKRHENVNFIQQESEGVKKLVALMNTYKPKPVYNLIHSQLLIKNVAFMEQE